MSTSYQFAPAVNGIELDGRSVCIVDDDGLYRMHLTALLAQANLRVSQASDSTSLTAVLDKEMPDCILLDYNLGAENGFRLYEQLKLRFPDLAPVIMLSADESQRTAIKAFRMGLNDFLPKRKLRIEELASAVRTSIARHDVEMARADEVSTLRRNAMFDDLTGMYSSEELTRKMTLVSGAAERKGRDFAVLSIRLADYAKICTAYGIANADEALRGFAGRIRSNIRSDDFCGRYDEDTFHYVIDSNVSEATVSELAARFQQQLTFSHHIRSVELKISPHIAVAVSGVNGDQTEMLKHISREHEHQQQVQTGTDGEKHWSVLPRARASAVAEPAERRDSVRVRTLKPAFIAIEEWSSKISCTVRNTSDRGARIRLEQPLALPEYFLMKITASGPLRRVRKCWHLNNEVGVEYCDQQKRP